MISLISFPLERTELRGMGMMAKRPKCVPFAERTSNQGSHCQAPYHRGSALRTAVNKWASLSFRGSTFACFLVFPIQNSYRSLFTFPAESKTRPSRRIAQPSHRWLLRRLTIQWFPQGTEASCRKCRPNHTSAWGPENYASSRVEASS